MRYGVRSYLLRALITKQVQSQLLDLELPYSSESLPLLKLPRAT
jgi:hypothetical protein